MRYIRTRTQKSPDNNIGDYWVLCEKEGYPQKKEAEATCRDGHISPRLFSCHLAPPASQACATALQPLELPTVQSHVKRYISIMSARLRRISLDKLLERCLRCLTECRNPLPSPKITEGRGV